MAKSYRRPQLSGRYTMREGHVLKSVDIVSKTQYFNLTTPDVFLVNAVAEGPAPYQRIGRRTKCISISMKGEIRPNLAGTAALDASTVRYMIVYDRQPNGIIPAFNEIIQATDSAGANTNAALDGMNLNNRDRFVILRDRTHMLPPIGVGGATPAKAQGMVVDLSSDTKYSLNLTEYIKTKAITQYRGATATIGDIISGAIVVVAVSNIDVVGVANQSAWSCTYNLRVRYSDLQ